MSALSLKPVDERVSIEPTYDAILTLVATEYDLTPGEIRAAKTEAAEGARDLFVWLADQLKSEPLLAAASFVAMPHADALSACHSVDRQRQASHGVRAKTDEIALCLQVEAGVSHKLGRQKVDATDLFTVARRAMLSDHAASRVSIREVQQMAAHVLATQASAAELVVVSEQLAEAKAQIAEQAASPDGRLLKALRGFVDAGIDLDSASGPGERGARQRFEQACLALQIAGETHFNIKRTFRGVVR